MEERPKSSQPSKGRSKKNQLKFYGKYAGMGLQMAAIILLFTFGGLKLDEQLSTSPLFTLVLSLISVVLAMYFVVKDLLKK